MRGRTLKPGFHFIEAAWPGTIYYLEAPAAPWLWPALALTGIGLQILAIAVRKPVLILAGFLLVALGSIPERDITLFVGDGLACIGLWFLLRKT